MKIDVEGQFPVYEKKAGRGVKSINTQKITDSQFYLIKQNKKFATTEIFFFI